jgi:hypothetical protein
MWAVTSLMIVVIWFIWHSVVTKNKSVAAFAQIGDLQEREQARENLVLRARGEDRKDKKAWISTQTQEKLAFTIGVINTGLTTYFLGAAPTNFFWYGSQRLFCSQYFFF